MANHVSNLQPLRIEGTKFYIDATADDTTRSHLETMLQSRGAIVVPSIVEAQALLMHNSTAATDIPKSVSQRTRSLEWFQTYLESGMNLDFTMQQHQSAARMVETPLEFRTADIYSLEEELLVAEYVARHPNANTGPDHLGFWQRMIEDCPWARTHDALAWQTRWKLTRPQQTINPQQLETFKAKPTYKSPPASRPSAQSSLAPRSASPISTKDSMNGNVPLEDKSGSESDSDRELHPTQLPSRRLPTTSERYRRYQPSVRNHAVKAEPQEPPLPTTPRPPPRPRQSATKSKEAQYYEEEYEIEKIVGARLTRGVVHYRVKWKDWPSSRNTWQPFDTLDLEDDAFGEFYKLNPNAVRPDGVAFTSDSEHSEDIEADPETNPGMPGHPAIVPGHAQETLEPIVEPPIKEKRGSKVAFASWRRRPNVLVGDSDPSQTTSSGRTKSSGAVRTQNTNPGGPSTQIRSTFQQLIESSPRKPKSSPPSTRPSSQVSPNTSSRPNISPPTHTRHSLNTSATALYVQQPDHDSGEDSPFDNLLDYSSEAPTDYWSSDEESDIGESYQLTGTLLSGVSVNDGEKRKAQTSRLAPISSYIGSYFKKAIAEYQSSGNVLQSQETSQPQTQMQAEPASQLGRNLKRKRPVVGRSSSHRLILAVQALLSHWLHVPLPRVRGAWKHLARSERTFSKLQAICLGHDLSETREEYDSTRIFTQQEYQPDSGGGRAAKRRKITAREGHSKTESTSALETQCGFGQSDERTSIHPPGDDEDSPPPILYRQKSKYPHSAKLRYPYPASPDREWAKVICRMLAALYGRKQPSRVYNLWIKENGNAARVEKLLKEQSSGKVLEYGEVPRPWLD